MLCQFILAFLTVLIYLIARGKGMAERQAAQLEKAKGQTDVYIRNVAEVSPAQVIPDARKLQDDGIINAAEFEAFKAKALA